MAVVKFGNLWSGRTGVLDDKYKREYVRLFRAVTNNKYDGPLTVCARITGCPQLWDAYENATGTESDPGALAREISPRQSDPNNPCIWDIEVKYSTEAADQARTDPNPILRPPKVRFSFSSFQRASDRDINGKACLNSAKLPFDPPRQRDDSRLCCTVTKNEPVYDVARALLYQDSVNSDAIFGGAIGTWKLRTTSEQDYENGVVFFSNTYDLEYRPDGWQGQELDRGKAELIQGKAVPITERGVVVAEPVLLDGSGRRLYPGANRTSILNGAMTDVQVELSVKAGGGAAFVTGRVVTVDTEDILLSSLTFGTTDSFQVVRGANGTTAAAHVDLSTVTQKSGAATYLTSGIGAADLTAKVYDFTVFGVATPKLVIKIDDEEILVTANVVGVAPILNTMTIRRGYNGTTAAAHALNAVVQQAPVFLDFTDYRSMPFAPLGLQ